MSAPTDPVLLQERLSSVVRDVESTETARVRAPLSAHPLPVATLHERLQHATTWLGRVWEAHARGGPAVRRWLTDDPLGSPVPPSDQRLPLRKQFRVALATAFLGASVAAGCYVLTAPLADPFLGLIPPDIFSRLPPFSERPAEGEQGEAITPQVGTAPGAPVVAHLPASPAPEPPPPAAGTPGSSEAVPRSGGPATGETGGGTSPQPPAESPPPPTAPPGTGTTEPTAPPTSADPPTTDPPTTTTTVPTTTGEPTRTTAPTTTGEPTGTAPPTTTGTVPTATDLPTGTVPTATDLPTGTS